MPSEICLATALSFLSTWETSLEKSSLAMKTIEWAMVNYSEIIHENDNFACHKCPVFPWKRCPLPGRAWSNDET